MLAYGVSAWGGPCCGVGSKVGTMQQAHSRHILLTVPRVVLRCGTHSSILESSSLSKRLKPGSVCVACATPISNQHASSRARYERQPTAEQPSHKFTRTMQTTAKHPSSSRGSTDRSRSADKSTGSNSTGGRRWRGSTSPKKESSAASPASAAGKPGVQTRLQSERPSTTTLPLEPRDIARAITACLSVQELQQQVQQSAADMHYIAISAAIVRLKHLLSRQKLPLSRPMLEVSSKLLQQLWQLLQSQLPQCKVRQLANTIYSLCLMPAPIQQQYNMHIKQTLLPAFLQQHHEAEPQHVSNVLYGMAKSRQQMQPVQVHQLLEQLCSNLDTAKPQDIANTLWAVATLALQIHDSHMDQLLYGLTAKVASASPQNVANSLWAVAALGGQVDSHQLHQLVDALVAQLQHAVPQNVSNTLWAVATMGQQVQQRQLRVLVDALTDGMQNYTTQNISNTLWAVATMGQQLDHQQLQQLLSAFIDRLENAAPQNISNSLWAVATMGQKVDNQQLQQLLSALVDRLDDAAPQIVSNSLWAVATMGQQVDNQQQFKQLLSAFVSKMHQANAQNVSNTLWACAQLRFWPKQLLATTQLYEMLTVARSLKHLSQIAWACGHLGHRDEQLMAALLQQAVQVVALGEGCSDDSSFDRHALCNICWSAAVLDLKQHAAVVLSLVQACRQQWDSMLAEEHRQLHQVHTWLCDCQLAGGQGLLGTLTQQQLQQCKQAWDAQMSQRKSAAAVSRFQQAVFEALCLIDWLQLQQMEQRSVGRNGEIDGAALIDITATTADGVLLAIEADGPTHFRQPDGALMGPTQHRNRVLAARGYVVVSVPHTRWDALWGNQQDQKQYLEDLVKEKLQVLSDSSPKTTQKLAKAGRQTAAVAPAVKQGRSADRSSSTRSSSTSRTTSSLLSGRVRRISSRTTCQSSATSGSAAGASQQDIQHYQHNNQQ